MRWIVAGTRTFRDYFFVEEYLNMIKPTEIISGGARGVDSLAIEYAREYNIPCRIFPANWDQFGKRAGFIRNEEMAKECNHLIVFWDTKSPGTQHMLNTHRLIHPLNFERIVIEI